MRLLDSDISISPLMRIHDFQKALKQQGVPAALLFNFDDHANPNFNFFYFTGYDGYGCLVVPASGKPVVLVPQMEVERARLTSIVPVVVYHKKFFETLERVIGKPSVIGLDYGSVSLLFHRNLRKRMRNRRFVDVSAIMKQLRMVKTETEIGYLRKACSISDTVLRACFDTFPQFKTEKEVYNFLAQTTRDNDCVFSFEPTIASGSHAARPHHKPDGTKIRKGFCVIDFGVKYKGYCSDTTRMAYLGTPSKKDLALYEHVLQALNYGITLHQPKEKCAVIHNRVAEALGKYQKYFTHALGHGVGVEIHEPPHVGPRSEDILAPNMAVATEPGVYFSGRLGIRIEDTLLVTKKKPKILTKIPKFLRIIR